MPHTQREEHIEKIRKACIEANREIVELALGCEFERFDEIYRICGRKEKEGVYLVNDGKVWTKEMLEMSRGITIIGRPIRLADVLNCLWLGEFDSEIMLKNEQEKCHQICIMWNLRNDSLTEQSDETLSFIANLL